MKKITKRLMAVVLCVAVLAGVAAFVASASGKEATIVFDASTKQFTLNNRGSGSRCNLNNAFKRVSVAVGVFIWCYGSGGSFKRCDAVIVF